MLDAMTPAQIAVMLPKAPVDRIEQMERAQRLAEQQRKEMGLSNA